MHVVVTRCAELISCDRHVSIQSALLSVSALNLHEVDQNELTVLVNDTDTAVVRITDDDYEDEDEEYDEDEELTDDESDIVPECSECNELKRLALVDNPPVLVQSGTTDTCISNRPRNTHQSLASIFNSTILQNLNL